jgi:hypothetical protein
VGGGLGDGIGGTAVIMMSNIRVIGLPSSLTKIR